MHPTARAALERSLWWLPSELWTVLDLATLSAGDDAAAETTAAEAGFRSRSGMACALAVSGLPPFADLAVWLHCLDWTAECAAGGRTLEEVAAERGRSPAAARHAIQRVVGLEWEAVVELGVEGVVWRFIDRNAVPALSGLVDVRRVGGEASGEAGRTVRRPRGWRRQA